MSTTSERPSPLTTAGRGEQSPEGGVTWLAAVRHALHRPLASYYLLLGSSTLLLMIGLMMVLSASSVDGFENHDGDSYFWFKRQATFLVVGLVFAFVAARTPQRLLRFLAWPAVLVALALLVATQFVGVEVNGNRNWLAFGPVQIQPSEIAKLAIVLWCADVYARKEQLLDDWRHTVFPVLPVCGLLVGVVVYGHDLGTALVLFAITLGMLWVVGAPGRLFAFAVTGVSVVALYLATTSSERRQRLTNFVDPFKDYDDAGWQPAHGLFAMSSGGIFGKGISASQQKWGALPEAHTDFIFAVLGEELGLVGTLLVLVLFLTIAYAAVRVALTTQDMFSRYVCAGVVIWLMSQMMINVGMVLTLLPVIGIPLPLVSYGGSALVPSLVALGLLVGAARKEPEAAAALQARRRSRSRRVEAAVTGGSSRPERSPR